MPVNFPTFSAAYAVPFMLNMAASGGSPTWTAAPVMLMPLRNVRLLSCIICLRDGRAVRLKPAHLATGAPFSQELRGFDQRNQQVLETEPRILEPGKKAVNRLLIRRCFEPSIGVSEHLADDTFLANRAVRQNRAELPRAREARIGQARDLPLRVDVDGDGRRASTPATTSTTAPASLARESVPFRAICRWRRSVQSRTRWDPSGGDTTRTSDFRRARSSTGGAPLAADRRSDPAAS